MDNIQYCQLIVKAEPQGINRTESSFSTEVSDVKIEEIEGDSENVLEQDIVGDTSHHGDNTSRTNDSDTPEDEIRANAAKRMNIIKAIEKENDKTVKIKKKTTTRSTRVKKSTKKVGPHPEIHSENAGEENIGIKVKKPRYTKKESKPMVQSFLSGPEGSLVPICYKGVVITKGDDRSGYVVNTEDMDKFKQDVNGVLTFCCEDCIFTTEHLPVFKMHFLIHANNKFITEFLNSYFRNRNLCYMCEFRSNEYADLRRHIVKAHRNKSKSKVIECIDDSKATVEEDDNAFVNETIDASVNKQNGKTSNPPRRPSTRKKVLKVKKVKKINKPKDVISEQSKCESEIQSFTKEESWEIPTDNKTFTIEIIPDADNGESIIEVVENGTMTIIQPSEYCTEDVKDIVQTKYNEAEMEWEDDCHDYDNGNDVCEENKEEIKQEPEDDSFLKEVKQEICIVKIERDPKIDTALLSHGEFSFKISNDDKIVLKSKPLLPLLCKKCNYVATTLELCKNHKCTGEIYICHVCGTKCIRKSYLDDHMKSHTETAIIYLGDKFQCGVCKATYMQKCSLICHIHFKHCTADNRICGKPQCLNGLDVDFICNECSHKFIRKAALREHIEKMHSVGVSYECDICKKKFKARSNMKYHRRRCLFPNIMPNKTKRIHPLQPMRQCELCEFVTKRKDSLQKHMLYHDNPKPYACSQCDYRGKAKASLEQHEITHIPRIAYSCTLCPFTTEYLTRLKKHKKTHGADGEILMIEDPSTRDPRYLYCEKCEFKTKFPHLFKTHQNLHNNVRPYLCPTCGATFTSSLGLLMHKNYSHTKSRQFKCSYCDYSNHMKNQVKIHERTHLNGRARKRKKAPLSPIIIGH